MNSACVFSLDDAYVMPFQVFFHSLERTESIPPGTPIYILHTDALSEQSIDDLQTFLTLYGREATFLDASHLIPADLPIREGDHVSPATFYRLFIADILPEEIEQAVYLDADMLALRSIVSLFRMSVDGLVAAVDHCSLENQFRLWGDCGGSYFQAGVLVIPIERWRQQSLAEQFVGIIKQESGSLQWWDQDVLNIALRDQWQRLPIWTNCCLAVRSITSDQLISDHALLLHFDGPSKPWKDKVLHRFTSMWDRAYFSCFDRPFELQSCRSSFWARLSRKVRVLNRLRGKKEPGVGFGKNKRESSHS